MQTPFDQPFNVPRENVLLILRWMQLANEAREHFHETQLRSIELQTRTLKRTHETLAAVSSPNEALASIQTILRDYSADFVSLMQECAGLEMSAGNVLRQGLSDQVKNWQSAWLGQMSRIAGAEQAAESVLRDVMQDVMQGDQPSPASPRTRSKGDQHAA
ncbi:hypothetical protein [Caballeronia sp. BR00000012568055]|uniref:hypothetical protein n=1 Tax=Caballeronia sp. BR00000012568055 TaxID=2918761 RepID=UPI0023F891F8|nr:hypothetical protein [Caballeronia sp. BR00000012568055]